MSLLSKLDDIAEKIQTTFECLHVLCEFLRHVPKVTFWTIFQNWCCSERVFRRTWIYHGTNVIKIDAVFSTKCLQFCVEREAGQRGVCREESWKGRLEQICTRALASLLIPRWLTHILTQRRFGLWSLRGLTHTQKIWSGRANAHRGDIWTVSSWGCALCRRVPEHKYTSRKKERHQDTHIITHTHIMSGVLFIAIYIMVIGQHHICISIYGHFHI